MKKIKNKIIALATLAVLLMSISSPFALASSSEEAEISQLNNSIKNGEEELKSLKDELTQLKTALEAEKAKKTSLEEQISSTSDQNQKTSLESMLANQQEVIDSLNSEVRVKESEINTQELFIESQKSNLAIATNNLVGGSLLPGTAQDNLGCEIIMYEVNIDPAGSREVVATRTPKEGLTYNHNDILACAIKTGDVKLWMIPFFIRFILEFVTGLAGLIAVGFVVLGGFKYLFSGLTEGKDSAKNTIRNGLIGLAISLLAWGIVNVVVKIVTSF